MPFERVYTGHFHTKQKIGNVYYPGSPIPFKFDEGDVAHGFYVYNTEENDHKFINIWKAAQKFFPEEIAPPQYCTILDTQVIDIPEEHINNNMLRVALQREYTDTEKINIRNKLIEMGARCVRWMNLNIEKDQLKEQTPKSVSKDLFKSWIQTDEKGTKDLDLGLLNKLHQEIAQEGDEIYSLEEVKCSNK